MVVEKAGGVRTPWTPPLDPPLGIRTYCITFPFTCIATLDESIVKSVSAEDESLSPNEDDPAIADCDVVVLHGNARIEVTAETFAFFKSEVCGNPDASFRMLQLRRVECCVTGGNGGLITSLFTILQPL